MLEHGRTLKTCFYMKEASHKGLPSPWSRLYEMFTVGKSIDRTWMSNWLRLVGERGENWGVTADENGVYFGGDGDVLKLIVIMVPQRMH